jgi:hypothetical protein
MRDELLEFAEPHHRGQVDPNENEVRVALSGAPDAATQQAFARALFWAIIDGHDRRVSIDTTGCRFNDLDVLQRLGRLGSRTADGTIEVADLEPVLEMLGIRELFAAEPFPLEGA